MAAIRKKVAIGEEEGRQLKLTDLPDEILIRILSMLPTKDAVRTCLRVLRRSRQQHLWKSLTRLDFREGYMCSNRGPRFRKFVDRVMDLRDHSVTLVSFSLDKYTLGGDDPDHIRRWITQAGQSNVEELTLSIDDDYDYAMENKPSCSIFGCQSLVKLDLEFIPFCVPSSLICLPRLKYLRLGEQVKLSDAESTKKLISSPSLEELIIDLSSWGITSIHVCCPKLQVLKMSITYEGDEYGTSKICIIGNNLKHFYYMGGLINEYRICAASSTQLNKVEIYVDGEMLEGCALNCYSILKGLSGTRNLALSDYFLQGLQIYSELLDTIPVFECVTRLDIRVVEEICIDSLALMKVYERCPHLEYLNVGKLCHTVRSPQLNPIPLCFRSHLKKILVHYYVPGDEDDAPLDVFLNSALVLEELVIYCEWDEDKGFYEGGHKIQELQDRLNRRPRVSKDCIISVRLGLRRWSWYYDDCYLKSLNES